MAEHYPTKGNDLKPRTVEPQVPIEEEYLDVDVIPVGGIMMWSGSVSDVPEDWELCDGTGDTPDLTDRFILGAGGEYGPGETGGEEEVQLSTSEMPSHSHGSGSLSTSSDGEHSHSYDQVDWDGTSAEDGDKSISQTSGTTSETTGSDGEHSHSVSGSTSSSGSNSSHENMPPYYALAFIMFVGGE